VVFKKGEPAKADYRMFRLRSTAFQNDDFKSLTEVMNRRLNYLPVQLPEGYKMRKAKKSEGDKILEIHPEVKELNFDVKQFYVIEKKKKIIAFGRVSELSEKVHMIDSLWVDDKERGKKLGYHLLRHLIEKSKAKRFYIFCKKELEDYYLKFGFEILREAPKELQGAVDDFCKVCQPAVKTALEKPLYFAYQKKKKDLSFTSKPDLIVIDGGKGQLHAAHEVLFSRGLNIPMISLAKKLEEVFIPGKSEPIDLPNDTEASYLLQRLRDEAHRFAIEANRGSREKKMTQSSLDDISGVGPKVRKKLLTYFGSVHKVKEASQVVLEQVVGEELAKRIKENL
jgi:N-acetylglutamate synthase-like GNAT family acetyltransferase